MWVLRAAEVYKEGGGGTPVACPQKGNEHEKTPGREKKKQRSEGLHCHKSELDSLKSVKENPRKSVGSHLKKGGILKRSLPMNAAGLDEKRDL